MTLKRVNINNMQSRSVTADTHKGNVVAGLGNVQVFVGTDVTPLLPVPKHYHGTAAGYTFGGINPNPYHTPNASTVIDKFPFASDQNATDAGDLTQPVQTASSASSDAHGYRAGGEAGPTPLSYSNVIDKFPFANTSGSTDHGDLTDAVGYLCTGTYSTTHGYAMGGAYPNRSSIDKYSFGANSNATDIGSLTSVAREGTGGVSSGNGYCIAGNRPSSSNTMDKFPFSSDTNATDIGELTGGHGAQFHSSQGNSSETHMHVTGGAPFIDSHTKFPFAAETNQTDVGELSVQPKHSGASQNSTTHGYISGGYRPGTGADTIMKFSFTSDHTDTDVGEITEVRYECVGAQA